MFHITFAVIPYFDWLLVPQKGQFFEKKKIVKNLLITNCSLYEADTLHTCSWLLQNSCFC